MHGPVVVCWLLVALTGATGLYCLWRMRGAGGAERRAAGSEALMGLGMAVMAVPAAAVDTHPYGPALLAAFFALLCAAALGGAALAPEHRAHHAHHAVAAGAMVYTALAMLPTGGHAAHDPAGVPPLTGALLLYFTGYALWAGTRLAPVGGGGGAAGGPARAAAVDAACRVSMGIGMVAMLLTL